MRAFLMVANKTMIRFARHATATSRHSLAVLFALLNRQDELAIRLDIITGRLSFESKTTTS
jgi:hypothetical protein